MKIAILSDIHDNIWKLETLLAGLKADVLVFCGDFCAPFTLAQIAEGFAGPIHVTSSLAITTVTSSCWRRWRPGFPR